MSGRRYTETDVRRMPELTVYAIRYLRFREDSSWVPIRHALGMVNRTGTLTPPVTAHVLNLARADGAVSDQLPEPPGPPKLGFSPAGREVKSAPPAWPSDRPARPRFAYFWGEGRWGVRYVYHVVDASRCLLLWVGSGYALRVRSLCCYMPVSRTQTFGHGAEPPMDMEMCASCAKQIEQEGKRRG